jgi:hypothetical protein
MASFIERLRSWDVRIWASIGASVLLIVGVMWTIPFTPDSNNFTFDTNRRDVATARFIDLDTPTNGQLVDGSDTDFYRIAPLKTSVRLDVHMMNGSQKLIPAVRVYDTTKNIIVEKSKEYLRSPGANLDCTFLAQSNTTYYVQVLGQRNTSGPYQLTVTVRTP